MLALHDVMQANRQKPSFDVLNQGNSFTDITSPEITRGSRGSANALTSAGSNTDARAHKTELMVNLTHFNAFCFP